MPPGDRTLWQKPGFLVSAGFLGAIILMAIALVIINAVNGREVAAPTDPAAPTSTHSTPPASSTPTSTQPKSDSVCGLEGVELTGTVKVAPTVEWLYAGMIAAPKNDASGPGRIDDDDYRACFAHTPEGAVLAATNMAALGSNQTVREKFLKESFLPGPGQEKALNRPAPTTKEGKTRVEIVGFRVMKYSGDTALIDVAAQSHSYQFYMSVIYELRWHAGDWKYVTDDDGGATHESSMIYDLSGYVIWPPKS
jgi:hypothetical protein